MSFSEAQDLKEQVRAATDIVALVGAERSVEQRGRNYVALCPFHDDSNPSLTLNRDRQTWRCWTCNEGGDVFSYVQRRESVDFRGALQILADRAGIELKTFGPKPTPGSANDKATLYKAMTWAETQFHRFLLDASEAAPAREYLAKRQINSESIDRYKIGYAPQEWQWLIDRAKSTPFNVSILEALGLVKLQRNTGRPFDFFRGRVIFPIRNTQDQPIGVGGRILPEFADDQTAKYFNSPETRLYAKSEQLYGMNVCRQTLDRLRAEKKPRNVVVMEGYTDVVMSRQLGVETPVAVCGTALTEQHVNLVSRFADRLTLVFDGDAAGQDKAKKLVELYLAADIELRVATLPDRLDPCEFVIERGSDEFDRLVAEAQDSLDFTIAAETHGINLAQDSIAANQALKRILTMVSKSSRSATQSASEYRIREQLVVRRLSRKFGVDEKHLSDELHALTQRPSFSGSPVGTEPAAQAQELTSKKLPKLHGWEVDLFTLLIQNPDAVSAVIEKVAEDDMRTETGRKLLVIYQEIEAEGRIPECETVLTAVEDPQIKSVLVELLEEADRMQGDDTDLQLRDLLAAFGQRRQDQERRHEKAELESGTLSSEEELNLLKRLFPPSS